MQRLLHLAAGVLVLCLAACARDLSRPARVLAVDRRRQPEHPAAAWRARTTGVAVFRFDIDGEGRITRTALARRSGPTREHRLPDHPAEISLARRPVIPALDSPGKPISGVVPIAHTRKIE